MEGTVRARWREPGRVMSALAVGGTDARRALSRRTVATELEAVCARRRGHGLVGRRGASHRGTRADESRGETRRTGVAGNEQQRDSEGDRPRRALDERLPC